VIIGCFCACHKGDKYGNSIVFSNAKARLVDSYIGGLAGFGSLAGFLVSSRSSVSSHGKLYSHPK